MDARHTIGSAVRCAAGTALLCALTVAAPTAAAQAAEFRTPNFVVQASSPEVARQVGEAAERYRRKLAVYWLGAALPGNWRRPCPVRVKVGDRLGAGGATSFLFDNGEVFGWQMEIQGPLDRLLDSVLPHEVSHTIFASHFRQPLPRWADEGACTTVEHASERRKQFVMLVDQLKTSRGIPFSRMFQMTDYPQDVMPLYSQGHSLVTFLLQRGGPRKFVRFLEDGLKRDDWRGAIGDHYGFASLGQLQTDWLDWVRRGSPLRDAAIAANEPRAPGPAGTTVADAGRGDASDARIVRGQSTDELSTAAGEAAGAASSGATAVARSDPAAPGQGGSRYRRRRSGFSQAGAAPKTDLEADAWRHGGEESIGQQDDAAGTASDDITPPRVVRRRERQVLLEWTRPEPVNVAQADPLAAPEEDEWPGEVSGGGVLDASRGGEPPLRR